MKRFPIILAMLLAVSSFAFANNEVPETQYVEYSQENYEKWAKMVVKYNATQWMQDGEPTWAMWEIFCNLYPCTEFGESQEG